MTIPGQQSFEEFHPFIRSVGWVGASAKKKKKRFGQRFAKEVGMGDPAEENDPPPES